MIGSLAGRVALVTGSSRGVGRGIAVRLAADGTAVAVNYGRDRGAADEVVQEISAAGGPDAFCASIDDPAAVAAMVCGVRRDLGPIGILVSNAGPKMSPEPLPSWYPLIADTSPARRIAWTAAERTCRYSEASTSTT